MKLPLALFASTVAAAAVNDPASSLIDSLVSYFSSSDVLKGPLNPFPFQLTYAYREPIQATLERNAYITRNGSELLLAGKRYTASGANVYWLGLDENVQPAAGQPFYAPYNASYPTKGRTTEVMNTLQVLGGRTIRSQTLGISVGNPLSVMPELGKVNEQAFDSIDWAVYQARQHGIRLFAPLTDNYDYYHGGKFVFLRWRGINITSTGTIDPKVQEFYTNPEVISDFKYYIKVLLTHTNPWTGLMYAEDPTIFAYETGNELGGPTFGDMDVPVSWTSEISAYIKELAPTKLVIDGTYGVNKTHLSIPSIDIFSDHFYPPNNTKLTDDIALVGSVNKVYLAAEYGWTLNPDATPLEDFFGIIESQQAKSEPVVAGDQFWSLFIHNVPDCSTYVNHNDGFTLQYGNPANPTNVTEQISKIRQHLFKMKGQAFDATGHAVDATLPIAPCPGVEAEYTYM